MDKVLIAGAALVLLAWSLYGVSTARVFSAPPGESSPRLGNFSVSLAVKDLAVSREFYEKLGFRQIGGDARTYLIMQNDQSTIGLFQGLFEKNILTYNPGWDRSCNTLEQFDDVREIQRVLVERGVKLDSTPQAGDAPASMTLTDPDGNMILIDQHVARPKN